MCVCILLRLQVRPPHRDPRLRELTDLGQRLLQAGTGSIIIYIYIGECVCVCVSFLGCRYVPRTVIPASENSQIWASASYRQQEEVLLSLISFLGCRYVPRTVMPASENSQIWASASYRQDEEALLSISI